MTCKPETNYFFSTYIKIIFKSGYERILMKNILNFSFLTILYIIFFMPGCSKDNAQFTFYKLKTRIEPASKKIEVEARIKYPPDSCFYLNRDLEILRISSNGRTLSFRQDSTKYLPYTVGAATIINGAIGEELIIEYAGAFPEIINGVNMIDSSFVELALYAAWYPMFRQNTPFAFVLVADLPECYKTVTNGTLEKQVDLEGRQRTEWRSIKPGSDIVLIAGPTLKRMIADQEGTKTEIYFDKIPEEYITSKMDSMAKAINRFTEYYGSPRIKGLLRFVYAPRSGWGYSRIPLFVVSEKYALSLLKEEFGQARDYHGAFHEMAHFWWLIADANTPDDWINEGLAEYSAFRMSKEFFGKSFADVLVKEYSEHALQDQTNTPIAETTTSSNDRYVNRYEKTVLIFIEAGQRYGQEKLDNVFKALHIRFAGTRNATTTEFLNEIKKQLGPAAEKYFHTALYQTDWIDPAKIL